MFHVAMNRASNRPIIPLTTDAQRATPTSCESVVEGRKRFQKSIENAVATLLILLDIVLIVAAKIAAMSAPAIPAGIWLIIKNGKMASDCPIVMSSSAGCVL